MNTKVLASITAVCTLLSGGSALAHHSGAMFDRTKQVTLTGTVKDWQWTNPHTWLILVATNDKGEVVTWNLEGQSPQVQRGRGWSRAVLKAGDKVTVTMFPLRDGAQGGSIASVLTVDGKTYR